MQKTGRIKAKVCMPVFGCESDSQITEEELIGLLDQISTEETKRKETKIVVRVPLSTES